MFGNETAFSATLSAGCLSSDGLLKYAAKLDKGAADRPHRLISIVSYAPAASAQKPYGPVWMTSPP